MSLNPLPPITDIQTGSDYLAQLSLANPLVAERQLSLFLDALLLSPPDPGVLFSLLEQARAPLAFVEDEMARRYHNKSLPLATDEELCFQQVVDAWRKMGKAYALCARLEKPQGENPNYQTMVATILHRCIYYAGMVVIEHYRARRELPPGIWLDLHGYYETAEEWGIAYAPVEESLESSLQATHCAAAYIALLLVDIASPYSNSVRNLNLIRRWAGMWAPLVAIRRLGNELEIPPYVVELQRDQPLHPSAHLEDPGNDSRYLDTTHLGLQINHMLGQLRLKLTPSQLGLGEETSGHTIQLLEHLYRPWTQSASPRRFRRFASEGIAQVAVGFDAMHFCVSGKPFEQPESAAGFSRVEFDQLFTFRDRVDPEHQLAIKPVVNFPVDAWAVINHSANGFRLSRAGAGQRVNHGQLMVVRPHDGERFFLVFVSWLMETADGGLVAGVATLPGMPEGVGVKMVGDTAQGNSRFAPAFLLPQAPAIQVPASLVLPSGFYQASRVLEVHRGGDAAEKLRMVHVLQRGSDFDRVSYEGF